MASALSAITSYTQRRCYDVYREVKGICKLVCYAPIVLGVNLGMHFYDKGLSVPSSLQLRRDFSRITLFDESRVTVLFLVYVCRVNPRDMNLNEGNLAQIYIETAKNVTPEFLDFLLDLGIDPNASTDFCQPLLPLFLIRERHFHPARRRSGSRAVLEVLLKHGANFNAPNYLATACSWNSLNTVRFLLENGADLNGPAHDLNGLFQLALINNNSDVVAYLLAEQGVDIASILDNAQQQPEHLHRLITVLDRLFEQTQQNKEAFLMGDACTLHNASFWRNSLYDKNVLSLIFGYAGPRIVLAEIGISLEDARRIAEESFNKLVRTYERISTQPIKSLYDTLFISLMRGGPLYWRQKSNMIGEASA